MTIVTSDYADGCLAGREVAVTILQSVRTDPNELPKLVRALRAASSDAKSDDPAICGHGIGLLFAIAESCINEV